MLPRRGWVGWIEEHSKVLGALSIWILVATGGIGALIASASGNSTGTITPAGSAQGTTGPSSTSLGPGSSTLPGGKTGKGTPGAAGPGGAGPGGGQTTNTGTQTPGNSGSGGSGPGSSGGTQPTSPCSQPTQPKAQNGQPETGISEHSVTIGQIITGFSQLPQQFQPAYEGLSAWVDTTNKSGGICGRQIDLVERDDSPPSNTNSGRYQELVSQVFAFVGTSSLFDSQSYECNAPFNPAFKDDKTDEYVPDIGTLALGTCNNGNYNRSQSPWHAGIIGSLSPVLTGGGPFHAWMRTSPGNKCRKGAILYLNEPTGASKGQADIGAKAISSSWGGGLPTKEYSAPLASPEPYYVQLVQQMIGDGMNCVFTYADRQSNVNLLHGMHDNGVWPPDQCSATRKAANQCFELAYMPFTAADQKFVDDAGGDGQDVRTFIPHVPFNEATPGMRAYQSALGLCNKDSFGGCDGSAQQSTFSVLGYASGVLFGEALQACGGAPTRDCVMNYTKNVQNFTANGLLGQVTPFHCTKVNFNGFTWCYKWIFNQSITIAETGSPSQGINAFRRIYPSSGFLNDTLHIVAGSPG